VVWQRTGVVAADLREAVLHGTAAGVRPVVLVRLGGNVHALDGACPHLGGELADGTLERGQLTCPLHGAVFDVETGAVRADPFGVSPPEGAVGPVASYPVRVVDGAVEVDVPEA
jgi:3-phenylpropionate/trans-cinnamate dioxygenase ferredoxin component